MKNTVPFSEKDPFNNNEVEGWLYRAPNLQYGMLFIEKVNGRSCPQTVWATPKLHYPFDENGRYHFPSDVAKVEVYEKLDGTNVLAYIYLDADCNEFVSYKTRLTPFIREGERKFITLWREILNRYPKIPELCFKVRRNVSYELYGKRNKELLEYDTSLDARVLFFRRDDGAVLVPSLYHSILSEYLLQHADLIATIDSNSNLEDEYNKIVDFLNKKLIIQTVIENGKEVKVPISGLEGTVWYMVGPAGTIQYKCKPDLIKEIHMLASVGIPRHSIYSTCKNAFEDMDNPTVDYIKQLLSEEFSESDIERKILQIERILSEVKFDVKLRREIIDEYNKHPDFDIAKDKRTVMRYFSNVYPKAQITRVYTVLIEEFGYNEHRRRNT